MSGQLTSWRVGFAVFVATAALLLVGCSSTISGRAQPAVNNGTVDAVSVTNTPKASPSRTTTGKPSTTSGNTDFSANIGDCVTLGGTTANATIAKASCGSRAANYKVIDKKSKSSQCSGDADNYYAETLNGIEQGAYCLDIDWVVGGCMDVGGDDPKRIDCVGAAPVKGVKVIKRVDGASDVGACDSGTGYVYEVRRFVMCVQEL
ncbi:hypothetical protein [Nocardia sp. NPDC049149]|uniref:LppU family putative lipoprotein n=1 Tax=Nocardia sp. NPDC049149 TaxID=3364315 RepID=UPI00371219E6